MRHQRIRLGILPVGAIRSPWKKWELDLLRKQTDSYTAKATGRSALAVRVMRRQLGVFQRQVRSWTAEERALVGTASHAKIAKLLGPTRRAVTRMRGRLS